jgi:acetyltransferase-like isoleucine patch superfamily enzyme
MRDDTARWRRAQPRAGVGRVIPTDEKPAALDRLHRGSAGPSRKYADFFTGRPGLPAFLRYELANAIARPCPGALGYFLRSKLWPGLLAECGTGVPIGEHTSIRHPGKIRIGARSAIDDFVLLCARGAEDDRGFVIGDDVLVTRHAVLQVRLAASRSAATC